MLENVEKELIAFYNVENLFLPDPPSTHKLNPTLSGLRNWNQERYKNKLFKISHTFQLIKDSEGVLPMLIGLSEIQGQQPLDELSEMDPFLSNYGVVHYDSLDERGVDVALLYDKTKIELLSSEPITYFFEINEDNTGRYDTTRDVLYCRLTYSNKIMHVFVLHLPSKREKDLNKPKRYYILSDLKEKISKIQALQESVVICGDFNENPDEEMIMNLGFNEQIGELLINPFLNIFQNRGFSTFHYKDGLLFDQIILSPDFFDEKYPLKFIQAKVFNHEKLRNYDKAFVGRPFRTYAGTRYLGGYSDHFPVITEFRKNKL